MSQVSVISIVQRPWWICEQHGAIFVDIDRACYEDKHERCRKVEREYDFRTMVLVARDLYPEEKGLPTHRFMCFHCQGHGRMVVGRSLKYDRDGKCIDPWEPQARTCQFCSGYGYH